MTDPPGPETLVAARATTGAGDPPSNSGDLVVIGSGDGDGASTPARSPSTPAAAILAGLAVPGLDLDEARHLVTVRSARRIRRRRVVMGSTCAVVAVGLAVLLWPRPDPREINADGERTTTTSSTIAPATTAPPTESTVVVTTVAPTTSVAPTLTTLPVTTLAPTTTVPPNQPMAVSARLVDVDGRAIGDPAVAQTVVLEVSWSDADVVDPASVSATADFGDPAVSLPISGTTRPPCDGHGSGATGVIKVPFRYATPTVAGQSTNIRVEVTACDGQGAYGERRTLEVPVRVAAAASGSRAVVIGGGDGRSPDAGEVIDPAGAVLSPPRVPDLQQVLADGSTRATVATVPATQAGRLLLKWGTACQETQSPVAPGTESITLALRPGMVSCPL